MTEGSEKTCKGRENVAGQDEKWRGKVEGRVEERRRKRVAREEEFRMNGGE